MSKFEAHNYYPNLVPLLMAYLYFWLGGVADHLVQAVFPLWGGGIVVLSLVFCAVSVSNGPKLWEPPPF